VAVIATAIVELIPSLRGGGAEIRKQLGGVKAGEEAGRDVGVGLSSSIAAAGDEIGVGFADRLREAGGTGGAEGGRAAGAGLRLGILGGTDEAAPEMRSRLRLAGAEAGREAGEEAGLGLRERFLESVKDLAAPLLAFFAADKIGEFFKSAVEAGETAESTGKIIDIQLRNTGKSAGVSQKLLDSLTTSIGTSAGQSREQVELAESALLKFSAIKNTPGSGDDIFTRATKDSADLAAVMHTSLPDAAATLGKALDGNSTGLTRLARAGIVFSTAQTAQIKKLEANGHTVEAQRIILGKFEKQQGGAAAASVTASQRFGAATANLKQAIGTQLLPIVDNLVAKFETKMIPVLDRLPGLFHKAVVGLTPLGHEIETGFGKAWDYLVRGFEIARPIIETVFGYLKAHRSDIEAIAKPLLAIGGAIYVANKALGKLKEVGKALAAAFEVDPVILALTLIGVGLYEAYKHSAQFRTEVKALWAEAEPGLERLGRTAEKVFGELMVDVGRFWVWVKPYLIEFGNYLVDVVAPAVARFAVKVGHGFMDVERAAVRLWDYVEPYLERFGEYVLHTVLPAVEKFGREAGHVFADIGRFVKEAWDKVIHPTLSAIWGFIKGDLVPIFEMIGKVVGFEMRLVWWAIKTAWGIAEPIFDLWYHVLKIVLPPAFAALGWAFKEVWDHVLKPIFEGIATIFSKLIVPAFKVGIAAIKLLWAGLKLVLGPPIKFFVNTILDDGLIKGYNKIAGLLHSKKMDPITLPPGFANGGEIMGPGTSMSDSVPIMASAGEFMVNAGAYAANRQLVQGINSGKAAIGGGDTYVRVFLGTRELTDLVRVEVDSASSAVTNRQRYRAAVA
jgi:phage-related protein